MLMLTTIVDILLQIHLSSLLTSQVYLPWYFSDKSILTNQISDSNNIVISFTLIWLLYI